MTKKFRTVDDIQRDNENREREEFKKKLSGDVKDIFDDFFKPEPKKEPKKKKSKFWGFMKWFGILFLLMILLTFVLGIFWLLKFFLKGLFGFQRQMDRQDKMKKQEIKEKIVNNLEDEGD